MALILGVLIIAFFAIGFSHASELDSLRMRVKQLEGRIKQ
jgi:hypothetical protein